LVIEMNLGAAWAGKRLCGSRLVSPSVVLQNLVPHRIAKNRFPWGVRAVGTVWGQPGDGAIQRSLLERRSNKGGSTSKFMCPINCATVLNLFLQAGQPGTTTRSLSSVKWPRSCLLISVCSARSSSDFFTYLCFRLDSPLSVSVLAGSLSAVASLVWAEALLSFASP